MSHPECGGPRPPLAGPESTVEPYREFVVWKRGERRLLAHLRPEVLILDDFGLKAMRSSASDDLYEVIDGRYQKGSTIITTNRAFSEWPELFDNAVLASAAIDRLAPGATHLVIKGDSYRARGTPKAAAGGGKK